MALQSGSISYMRLVAVGEMSDAPEEAWCAALAERGFMEIDPTGELQESCGWVRFDDAFESNYMPHELIGPGGVVLLRMRVDTLKIPAATLKAHIARAVRERSKALGVDKLTRTEKDAVRDEMRKQLRRRSLPRMQLIECAWNLGTGELRLATTGRRLAGLFVDLFEKTFALQLRVVGPQGVLWLRGLSAEELDALGALQPEKFHLSSGGPGLGPQPGKV